MADNIEEIELRNRNGAEAADFGVPISKSEVAMRIKQLVEGAGGPKRASELTGLPVGTINNAIRGVNLPGSETLAQISKGLQRSLDWIMFGKEPGGQDPQQGDGPDQELWWVPRLNIRAAAGAGAVVVEEEHAEKVPFPMLLLRNLRCNIRDLVLMEGAGDSMEPTLADGEPILVDRSINRIWRDSIYVLRFDDELLVKRVQRDLGGGMTVISDNPRYAAQKLTAGQLDQVSVVGEVVWPPRR